MSITVQHQKEALGQAYVRAVIAKAGFNFGKSEHDYGYDGTIKTDEPRTPEKSRVRGFLVTNVCIVQRSAA